MADFNPFDRLAEDIYKNLHDFRAAGDTFKIYLTNATPSSSNSLKADIAEISAGNGYTAGGEDMENDEDISSGVVTMTAVDKIITASGGSIGPFQYAVLYNDTATDDPLMGWWDYGSSISIPDGEDITLDVTATGLLAVSA